MVRTSHSCWETLQRLTERTGTYVIDPCLPIDHTSNRFVKKDEIEEDSVEHNTEVDNLPEVSRVRYSRVVERTIEDVIQRKLCAAMRSRQGNISLDLIISSMGCNTLLRQPTPRTPTPVSIFSRHGNVSLNLVRG